MNNNCAIYVDAGTTNTRVWLMRSAEILARASTMVGVRDSARDGSTEKLCAALRDLIVEVRKQTDESPSCVIAAGMITVGRSARFAADNAIAAAPSRNGITRSFV